MHYQNTMTVPMLCLQIFALVMIPKYTSCTPAMNFSKGKTQLPPSIKSDWLKRDWLTEPTTNEIAEIINATVRELQSSEGWKQFPKLELTYDPDTKYNASGLISSKGYPVQDYEVPTKDGFILEMQRIPHGRNRTHITGRRPAVLLQHGLLACSSDWVSNLANESLAFILADAGYDVWLGNIRGNTYGKKHRYLNETQKEFWYWSWDEMAKYDLPAMVDFVVKTTRHKSISYVAHSQGTTMAFAGLSTSKDLQSKINLVVALGPVANTSHMTSSVGQTISHPDVYLSLVDTLDELHHYVILPHTPSDDFWANTLCDNEVTVIFCEAVFNFLGGYSVQHMNASRIPVYASNNPAGTSIWNIEHWAQITHTGNFAMFDYGPDGNMDHYGQDTPPIYDVTAFDIPVALFYGGNDILADQRDVEELIPQLQNVIYKHKIDTYGHLDFIWAIDAVNYVYKDILKLLKEINQV